MLGITCVILCLGVIMKKHLYLVTAINVETGEMIHLFLFKKIINAQKLVRKLRKVFNPTVEVLMHKVEIKDL